jgi:hypothetical protein
VEMDFRGLVGRACGEGELTARGGARDGDGEAAVGGSAGDDEVATRMRVGDEVDFSVKAAVGDMRA